MSSGKYSQVQDTLVDQLCNITGVSRVVATNLLEACDNNLEMALNMQMEGLVSETNGESNNEDEVRAPIPQRQEVLVEGPDALAYSFRSRTKTPRSVFDKFRDFEAETRRQEELMMDESCASTSNSTSKKRIKKLEDLFRPPLHLIFRGNFQAARDAGVASKKWLMVNVQNSNEFQCQVLNRDVWSNSAVQSIVQEHFIFWQVYHDSEDGQRYMTFYPVEDWPYIAVIDPRTGESLAQWKRMDAVSFCEIITEFISSHQSLDDSFTSPITTAVSPPTKKIKPSESVLDADESTQMEAAIKASLASFETETTVDKSKQNSDDEEWLSNDAETFESDEEPHAPKVNGHVEQDTSSRPSNSLSDSNGSSNICSKSDAVTKDEQEQSQDSSDQGSTVNWKDYLGKESDPLSKIVLRLPDGTRDAVEMPSTSKLMALILYVGSKGYSNERFELVTNFPKRRLSYLDFHSSLKTIGIFPQETVFVEKR